MAWWGRCVGTNFGPTPGAIFTSVLLRRGGQSGCDHGWSYFEAIRRDRRDGWSIRELADRHSVHRRTVKQALSSAVPPPRKPYQPRPRPSLDDWTEIIDGWLIADQQVPRKQRHTARRVWQRLVAEHQAVVSESTVSRYVTRRRQELGLVTVEVNVPQTHEPGAEAEVDFGEFFVHLAGAWVKCWMFVMRLSNAGKAFHVGFTTQAQEAFLEGHVLAFEYFGGVPGRIRYDNLSGGHPGLQRQGPGRSGTVHRPAKPLRVRIFLLPARGGRRPREGLGFILRLLWRLGWEFGWRGVFLGGWSGWGCRVWVVGRAVRFCRWPARRQAGRLGSSP